MMIDHISENPSTVPSVHQADGDESTSFNSMLSNEASALAKGPPAFNARLETSPVAASQGLSSVKPVKIGTITSKNPTVSDLLIRNPALKKDCWNIIYAGQNRDKAYTCIPAGTDIYYNPETKELLWGDMMKKFTEGPAVASASPAPGGMASETAADSQRVKDEALPPASAESAAKTEELDEGLVDAVKPMIGKTYTDMNCYELLVNGLSKMGVRYFGRGGLGRRMIAGAMDKGLPMNAYLNGEGLIQFSGSQTYRKAFFKVSDPVGQAREVIEEMASHLEKGSILSFSTESRGHAGIVSSKGGVWTYINSGVMDNPVDAVSTSKGVGEENLDKEIESWFKMAARRNESLVITLGKLNQNKLAAYGTGNGHRA